MNEFTTLMAAPGQMPGEITLSAVRSIELAGQRVVVHLHSGQQVLLDEAASYTQLQQLPGWMALDGARLIRSDTIVRMRPAQDDDYYYVQLVSGEIVISRGAYAVRLLEACTANLDARLSGHPLDAGRQPPWPTELPEIKRPPMSEDFRKMFVDIAHRSALPNRC